MNFFLCTPQNLAHNSFTVVPRCLACFCPNLSRLNLSYNCVSSFGSTSNYPLALKHLDLSYNQIYCWPGDVPAASATTSHGGAESVCYAEILNCDIASSPISSVKSAKEGNDKR